MIGAYAALSLGLACFACAVRGWPSSRFFSRRLQRTSEVGKEPVGLSVTTTGDHSQIVSGKTSVAISGKARATVNIASPGPGRATTSGDPAAMAVPDAAEQIGDRRVTSPITSTARPFAPVSIAPPLPLALREKDRPLRGRDGLVHQLVARVQPRRDRASVVDFTNRSADSDKQRTVLLYGPAGCAKTSIAEQVAYEAASAGVDVWWVDAVDQAAVDAGMNAVASLIGVPRQDQGERTSAADALWRALRTRDRPWLLVADGVDDSSLLSTGGQELAAGTGWLRPLASGPGLVLVTSRDSALARWGDWWDRQPVRALPPEDGALIIRDYTADRAGTKADAQALSTRLSGLPLALKLAGAYLAVASKRRYPDSGPATLADYKRALDKDRLYHLPQDEQDISRIWQLSIDLLERRGLRHAGPLLRLLCCLADAPIPDQLVLDPAVLAASGLFNGLDGTGLQLTVDSLADLGLIDLVQAELSSMADGRMKPASRPGLVTIHPLLRHAVRLFEEDSQSGVAMLILAATLLHVAAEHCGQPEDHRSWPAWQALAPHCIHVLGVLGEYPESGISPDAVRLVALATLQAAVYLGLSHAEEQAEAEFTIVLDILHNLPGDNRREILKTRAELACILRDRGQRDDNPRLIEEAELKLRAIYAEQQRLLAYDEIGMTGLPGQLGRAGWDTPEGLALLEGDWDASDIQALRGVLYTHQALAITLAYQDENSVEAKQIYQSEYEVQRRLLGDSHIDTLATRTGLAARLYYEGRLEEAEREFRVILEADRKNPWRGPDDPATLQDHEWLAGTLQGLARLEEAELEYRVLCTDRERVLGPEDWDTRRAKHGLASVLLDRGRQLTAQTMPDGEVYRIYEGAATVVSRESENELQQALVYFQEALGLVDADQDPVFYGVIMHDIGDTHKARGDREQAAAAYRDAVTYKRKRLPEAANGLAGTMEVLGAFLMDGDDLTEAQAMLDQLGEVVPLIAAPTERAARMHGAGRAYERLGTKGQEQGYAEALRYYTQAAELIDSDKGVRLSKRCLISGCFGHAARLRRSMVSSS